MALTKFKLVNTDGLKGLTIKGDFLPFDKITDELAEQLVGKTHVLERVSDVPAPVALALAEPTTLEEAPSSSKRKS